MDIRPIAGRLAALSAAAVALLAVGCGGGGSGSPVPSPTPIPGAFEVACSGAGCGATDATRYAGAGTGVWRYVNGGTAAATLDISISGVAAGNRATLVFSNGTASDTTLPSAGALAMPPPGALLAFEPTEPLALDEDPLQRARDRTHADLLAANHALGQEVVAAAAAGRAASRGALSAPPRSTAAAAVGDARTWREAIAGTTYDTVARALCDLPGGRRAVFWIDPRSTSAGSVTDADLDYFRTTFCGPTGSPSTGGFARVRALLGEPYGDPGPIGLGNFLIPDAPLQDVNVVFLEVPGALNTKTWSGYFLGSNSFLRTQSAGSNEALVFFVDATQVHVRSTSRSYLGSTLLHELTHMVNFWRHNAVGNAGLEVWLDETSATMTDDMVSPAATPDGFHIIPSQRIQPYLASGGDVSLIAWTYPAENSYAIAGAFAAFVDRRYGPSLLSGTAGCTGSAMACLDGLIRAGGGTGFADELARMGASIWALLPPTGIADGYGFPARSFPGYDLAAIDISAFAANRPSTGRSPALALRRGAQVYQLDTVAAGQAVYSRRGVVVPPGTTLELVIRPQ